MQISILIIVVYCVEEWMNLMYNIPTSLLLRCWWFKQSTSFILERYKYKWPLLIYGINMCSSCTGRDDVLLHSSPSSYLWCRESWEGKGQIRVVKRAEGRILGGECPVSSVGRLLHQIQWLMTEHVEQNMFFIWFEEHQLCPVERWFPLICDLGSFTPWSD